MAPHRAKSVTLSSSQRQIPVDRKFGDSRNSPSAKHRNLPRLAAVESFDVIVLGGGAAGLMCGMTAARRSRRVLVLERSNKIGKKILMSGGGRCNFTNLNCSPDNFVSANRDFCISALSRYAPSDFVSLVEEHGIAYHEKTAGQLFCDHSSRDILTMLVRECDAAGVTVVTHCDISSVECVQQYYIKSNKGHFECESLVVATGGLSIPKMGATDFGYRLARQFHIRVHETRAGLVPYTFSGAMHDLTVRLSGVSVNAAIRIGRSTFTGGILFTHRGLSGPAALQSSNSWAPGSVLEVNLLPEVDASEILLLGKSRQPQSLLRSLLSELLPRALVLELQSLWWSDVARESLAGISDVRLRLVAARLHAWRLNPSGTEGYRTAEVTLGGVDTDALSSQTMECRQQRGMYYIGEVVDVSGELGGFNFQWAWASAQAAGQVV